jgi:hypothetical protein
VKNFAQEKYSPNCKFSTNLVTLSAIHLVKKVEGADGQENVERHLADLQLPIAHGHRFDSS